MLLTVFLGLFPGPNVYCLDLEELTGPEYVSALIAGERPLRAQFRNPVPELIPQNETLQELFETLRRDLDPGVMVEILYLYPKPSTAHKIVWSAEEEAALYNEVLALSTLAGLQYYSASRGTMRTFYETSSVIDSPSAKRPLPDPVYPRPPAELALYARQKDLTFGDNVYRYDFYSVPGAIIFVQENLTALSAGIIPAVGRNKLRSTVAILDAGEYLLVYAVSMAKAASLPGMNERVGNSFSNRAEAVLHWLSERADIAFGKQDS